MTKKGHVVMRKFHFRNVKSLNEREVESILSKIKRINEYHDRIIHHQILLIRCQSCQSSRQTIKESRTEIVKTKKVLKDIYNIESEGGEK